LHSVSADGLDHFIVTYVITRISDVSPSRYLRAFAATTG
jgi:hypothetical protein